MKLLTGEQTDRQTDKRRVKRNLFGGGNKTAHHLLRSYTYAVSMLPLLSVKIDDVVQIKLSTTVLWEID